MKKLTTDDLESTDLVAENIERLKGFFPEIVTEGKIDFEVLKQLLGGELDERPEKYGITWHGKRAARRLALDRSMGTLRPAPAESIDWDTARNLMIEGDNLEVLKLLQKGYSGQVKLIYIDPPYNTGRDFIYPDNFHDTIKNYLEITGQIDGNGTRASSNSETSGRYHTDWLNMMYPRLMLARNLLRKDGVIFVSIGDHEVHNLRGIMDEVFGPENFIATVIWQKVYSPKNSARHFSEDHDYIVVYARDADTWVPGLLPRTDEQNAAYKNPDNDPRGPWKAGDVSARNYYSKGTYSITTPSGRIISGPPAGTYWRVSEESFWDLHTDNRIWWGGDGNGVPAIKRFLSEVKQGRVPQTIWPYSEVGHNQDAKKELLRRVTFETSDSVFDTPKPTKLIRRMLTLATTPDEDDIVLDFFAGSGTTGDAVMQANAADGGNRRFILVQVPEHTGYDDFPDVADITRARLKSAVQAVSEEITSGQCVPGTFGYRVLELDSSNLRVWESQPDDIAQLQQLLVEHIEHVLPGRTELDLLFEVLLRRGIELSSQIDAKTIGGKTVYTVDGVLFACFAEKLTRVEAQAVAEAIVAWRRELRVEVDSTVVFRDSAFGDNVAKINAAEILRQHGINTVESL